jgi:protein-S-isoprenylcysteine O-methyltransferase Ste14
MDVSRICGYLWTAFFVVWLIWAMSTKPAQRRESISSRLSYTLVTFAAFFVMFSDVTAQGWMHTRILPRDLWIQILGLIITVAGLGFAVWARVYLGGNWSGSVTVKVNHELVRTGPYRFVRHPIYSGIILALLGTTIVRGQVRGFVAILFLLIGFSIKWRIEERFMTNTFGDEYDDYKRDTGAIVPKMF